MPKHRVLITKGAPCHHTFLDCIQQTGSISRHGVRAGRIAVRIDARALLRRVGTE
ncbi:hypothetical protein ACVWXL_001891 [Bradyrhizobium sp. GM22.5]